MSMQLLVETMECRNGNCPTAWLTERGTVLVQGYVVTATTVRVPRDIIERAARELEMCGVQAGLVPAPRSKDLQVRDDWVEVAGTPTMVQCPAGERAHEVLAPAILAAATRLAKEVV